MIGSRRRGPLARLGRYREMASDVLWSGASDLLIMLAQLSSFILLGRHLPLDRYGGYVGLYGIIGPLGALSWAGLTLLVMQQIVREQRDRSAVGRSALTLTVLQGLVATVLALVLARSVVTTVSLAAVALLTVVDLLIVPLTMVTASLRQAIVGFPAAAKLRIGQVAVRATTLGALWATDRLTLVNLGLAWTVTLGIYASWCLLRVWPTMGLRVGPAIPGRPELVTNMQLSFPLASSNMQKDGDKAVLNYFGYTADAGIYGAAFRIVWMAQMPIQTLNNALFHRFLAHDDRVRGLHVSRAKRFTMVSVAVSVVVGSGVWLVAPLLPMVMGDKFDESVRIVRLLVFFLPLVAASHAPLNGLLGLKANTERAVIVVASAAVAVGLYLTLIPSMSWRGAVIGTIVSEAFLGATGWFTLIRLQRLDDAAALERQAAVENCSDSQIEAAT